MENYRTQDPFEVVFERLFDVERVLSHIAFRHTGWNPVKMSKKQQAYSLTTYRKRIDGLWIELSYGDWIYSTNVKLRAPTPRGVSIVDKPAYEAAREKLSMDLPAKGMTLKGIEEKCAELVKEYRALDKATRKPRSLEFVEYRSKYTEAGEYSYERFAPVLEGKDAIKRWKLDVENVIKNEIIRGEPKSTGSITGNILDNYCIEIDGVSKSDQKVMIRGILDSMKKRGILDKLEYGRRDIRWAKADR